MAATLTVYLLKRAECDESEIIGACSSKDAADRIAAALRVDVVPIDIDTIDASSIPEGKHPFFVQVRNPKHPDIDPTRDEGRFGQVVAMRSSRLPAPGPVVWEHQSRQQGGGWGDLSADVALLWASCIEEARALGALRGYRGPT